MTPGTADDARRTAAPGDRVPAAARRSDPVRAEPAVPADLGVPLLDPEVRRSVRPRAARVSRRSAVGQLRARVDRRTDPALRAEQLDRGDRGDGCIDRAGVLDGLCARAPAL